MILLGGLNDFCVQLQLSVRNCFIRGSVVRYVQLPPEGVDIDLLHDATRREARGGWLSFETVDRIFMDFWCNCSLKQLFDILILYVCPGDKFMKIEATNILTGIAQGNLYMLWWWNLLQIVCVPKGSICDCMIVSFLYGDG